MEDPKDSSRYDRDYLYGSIMFHLSNFEIPPDQSRFLLLKIVEQAVRDYTTEGIDTSADKEIWESARDLIYNDEYYFDWGDWVINLEEALDLLNIDISWFRSQTTKKYKDRKKHGKEK